MNRLSAALVVAVALPAFAQTAPPTTAPAPPISRVDESKYAVDPNFPYDHYSQTTLDMLYPKTSSPEKRPGVIMFHGGGWIRTSKSTMSTFYNRFLDHGFVVCNVEYRMAARDAAGNPTPDAANAPAAVEDALAAAKWFYDHAATYNVDQNRIVVTGASGGGHLALMVGMATPAAHLGPTAPPTSKSPYTSTATAHPTSPASSSVKPPRAIQWLPADPSDPGTSPNATPSPNVSAPSPTSPPRHPTPPDRPRLPRHHRPHHPKPAPHRRPQRTRHTTPTSISPKAPPRLHRDHGRGRQPPNLRHLPPPTRHHPTPRHPTHAMIGHVQPGVPGCTGLGDQDGL